MSSQVPEGYKQTEVGVIPEDWEVLSLQNACRETITYGIVQCGPHVKDGIPYIRVSDMDEQELAVDQMLRTSPAIAEKFSRSTVQSGDLVYALRGKLGEVRQIKGAVAGANLTQGTARLSPKKQIASDYLLWAMRNPQLIKQAEVESKGTTFREITLADLKRLRVLIPPLAKQHAIASTLSDIDALIAKLDKLIAKKRHLKTATMQQLLTGKKRLPGFGEGKGYQQTEIGVIPEDWELGAIGDYILEMTDYVAAGSFESLRNNVQVFESPAYSLYVRLVDLRMGLGHLNQKYVDQQSYKFLKKSNLFGGEILIANIGANVGEVFLMPCDVGFATIAPNMIILRMDDQLLRFDFSYQYIKSAFGQEQMKELIAGSGHPKINKTDLKKYRVIIPPVPEQQAIAQVLSDIDTEITAIETRRDKTKAIKQGMMQELLTGRTRLV